MSPPRARTNYPPSCTQERMKIANKRFESLDKDIKLLESWQIIEESPEGSTPRDFRMKLEEIRMVYDDPANYERIMTGDWILHDQIAAERVVLSKDLQAEITSNSYRRLWTKDPIKAIREKSNRVEEAIRDFAKLQLHKYIRRPRKSVGYFESQLKETENTRPTMISVI